jgi:hypothetical protein
MDDIIEKVALELNLPSELVAKTYKAFWKSVRECISPLPLKEQLSPEQYSKLTTSFNIPSLGKLHCTYTEYIGKHKKYKELKDAEYKEN